MEIDSHTSEEDRQECHGELFGLRPVVTSSASGGGAGVSDPLTYGFLLPVNGHAAPQPITHVFDQNGALIPLNCSSLDARQQATLSPTNLVWQVPVPALQQNLLVSPTWSVIGLQPLATSGGVHYTQMPVPTAPPIIHNLIPQHLQASALVAPCLHGTPGYQPALVLPNQAFPANEFLPPNAHGPIPHSLAPPPQPALTVQDRPLVPPVFNGVNPCYPGLRQVHLDPPVFVVDNFLTPFECDFLVQAANGSWTPAPVVGKGAGEISSSRTSSTCYLAREDLPDYMLKVSILTNKPIEHCELPQVGRYLPSQQYLHVSIRHRMRSFRWFIERLQGVPLLCAIALTSTAAVLASTNCGVSELSPGSAPLPAL
jgi:hypothetical protein